MKAPLTLTASLLALVTTAFAQVNPPPPPPPVRVPPLGIGLPFIDSVTVGHSDCDTCPRRTCPGEPVEVHVSGFVPPCGRFGGLHEGPPIAGLPVLIADFGVDTCIQVCNRLVSRFSAVASLPPQDPGPHAFVLRAEVRGCPDTTAIVDSSQVTIGY